MLNSMRYDHYNNFLAGYWRCQSRDETFDFYIREDGFHIGAIPVSYDGPAKTAPMPLWLSAEDSGELIVSNVKKSAFWTRNWYRDGNKLIMSDSHEPDTRSTSHPISFYDIDEVAANLIKDFCSRYPSKTKNA